jgi:PilX N-terminal
MALVMALLMAVVLLLLGTTLATVAVSDRRISGNDLEGARAFHLAEAGLEHAIAELPDQSLDTLLAAGGALFTSEDLGGGSYSVTLENNVSPDFPLGSIPADGGGATDDTDGYVIVTSTGTYGSAMRVVQIIAHEESAPPGWPYPWAAFGISALSAVGASEIIGPTGTNGAMTFEGRGPKVHGDAWAGSTITNPSRFVTGTATPGAPPQTFPPIPCPTIPWGPAPSGPNVTFDAANGTLAIAGSGTTVFASGDYYFSQISMSGSGTLTIPAGATVDIYVSGGVTLTGGGIANPNNTAESLQIWGCGGTTTDWYIAGTLDSWFTVYAPTNNLQFSGDGHRHGSFIGLQLSIVGNGSIAYDEGLSSGGGGPQFAWIQGTWTEVW